ncbi:VUT family protein [archaeon]|nr:MAG: VUT family protein [archaeon]
MPVKMTNYVLFIGLTLVVLSTAFSSLSPSSVGRESTQSLLTHPDNAYSNSLFMNKFANNCNHRFETELLSSSIVAASPSKGRPVTLPPHHLSIHQFVYLVLTATFVTCLVIADVIGVKIFEIKLPFPIFGHASIEHTCGMLTFPITFLLGDVINEYYGANATKQTVYIGLAMSILVFMVMNLAQALPYLQKPFNGKLFLINSALIITLIWMFFLTL